MRMMLKVTMPTESGNQAIKGGVLPKTMQNFMEQYKPEAAYFASLNGKRTAMFFFDLKETAAIPSVAEPFFMGLGAEIELLPVMNAEDLRVGLERAAKNF